MSDIVVEREGDARGGRYRTIVDGLESEMTFHLDQRGGGRVMVVTHTGVPKALSGRGVGLALVERAVADARQQGFHIEPQCSFVRVMFERRKDWQDVRADAA
jgi:uncharacterized protein